jgi:hypothetical protein
MCGTVSGRGRSVLPVHVSVFQYTCGRDQETLTALHPAPRDWVPTLHTPVQAPLDWSLVQSARETSQLRAGVSMLELSLRGLSGDCQLWGLQHNDPVDELDGSGGWNKGSTRRRNVDVDAVVEHLLPSQTHGAVDALFAEPVRENTTCWDRRRAVDVGAGDPTTPPLGIRPGAPRPPNISKRNSVFV